MKKAFIIAAFAGLMTGCSMFDNVPSPTASLASDQASPSTENGLSSGDAVGQNLFSPEALAARKSQDATATALTD